MTLPAQTLPQEKDALSRLVVNLQKEQGLLSETSTEGMTDLITEKAQIVSEMTTLAGTRHQTLAGIGFSADEQGMQTWLDSHGSAEDKEIWAQLFALGQEAKEINRLNGILIGKKMSINQSALTILQGKTNTGNFYGSDGLSNNKSVGRRLGVV